MPLKIFLHGLESNNQGTKAVYFREHFPNMLTPNFAGSLRHRMEQLKPLLAAETDLTLVGSSFGGLMAAAFALTETARVRKLVLLAPALNLLPLTNYPFKTIATPVVIYHGAQDSVVPLEATLEISQKIFNNCTFNKVADDHFLHDTFPIIDWKRLLDIP
ncbi:MAG: alpha/beta hydrolase [Desulfobacteraceae bacterium]|nr:MAG: alpha/beta hydrolase [Desulfobacteraceae bacterium]